jgi:hypothetical protein
LLSPPSVVVDKELNALFVVVKTLHAVRSVITASRIKFDEPLLVIPVAT